MSPNATVIIREALSGSGVELVASCGISEYDARAPEAFRSGALLPGARGLVVVGSAGPVLWRRFRAYMDADRARWEETHPLDHFVGETLALADAALAGAHIHSRRFEAAFHATPRLDFVAMASLVGLGSPGPFGMLIHAEHGAWWALRGAWLVDADVEALLDHRPPCAGCAAPCVGGWANAKVIERSNGAGPQRLIVLATPDARRRCVVGQQSRYDDDQIAYHYALQGRRQRTVTP